MTRRLPRISRRGLLGAGAAGAAGLALPGRRALAAAPPAPERRVGFALVGIGKLTQKQLIPALRATKIARLTALVSGHADKAKRVAAENGVPEHNAKPFSFPDIDQFAAEMDDFAACVRDGKPTRVPGEEGLRDVRIIDALYRSAATGRDVKLT